MAALARPEDQFFFAAMAGALPEKLAQLASMSAEQLASSLRSLLGTPPEPCRTRLPAILRCTDLMHTNALTGAPAIRCLTEIHLCLQQALPQR